MSENFTYIGLNPQLPCAKRFLESEEFTYCAPFEQPPEHQKVIARIGSTTPISVAKHCLNLQNQGTNFINNMNSVLLLQDKFQQAQYFRKHNIDHPLSYQSFPQRFPILVKQRRSMKGAGIFLLSNLSDYVQFITQHHIEDFYFQQPITDCFGVDFRLLYVNGEILGVMKRENKKSFLSNVAKGGIGSIDGIKNNEQEIVHFLATKLELNFFAADFLRTRDKSILLEVNTSPGFIEFEKVMGIDVVEQIKKKGPKALQL